MEIQNGIRKHEEIVKKLSNYTKIHLYYDKLIKLKILLTLRLDRIKIIEKECEQYLDKSIDDILNNDNISLSILLDNIVNEMPEEMRLDNNIYNLLVESFTILIKIVKIIKHNIFYYMIPTCVSF